MKTISTLTQKGQVVIPKYIRRYFNLKPNDKIKFMVRDAMIVAQPIASIDQAYGMFQGRRGKPVTQKEIKDTVKNTIIHKFSN